MASTENSQPETTSGFHVSPEDCFSTFKLELRPYQEKAIEELVGNLNKGQDAALNLPTGTGKTIVFLSIANAAINLGYRVAILVATNQIIGQIQAKYLPMFNMKVPPVIIKGIENYDCALTGEGADYGFCTPEQKTICTSTNQECDVLRVNNEFETARFVITNYHKFISLKLEHKFDLIIIDDSHGFENALDDKFQNRIAYYQIDGLFKRHNQEGDIIADFTGAFLDYFDDAFNSVPTDTNVESMRVPNDIVKHIADISGCDEVQSEIRKLNDLDRSICRDACYFVKCCQNTSVNVFYIQKDHYDLEDRQEASLIARKSRPFQMNVIKGKFRNSRIIFASATIGDVVTHANHCTFKGYTVETISVVPKVQPDEVKNWFNGLKILETHDFPQNTDDQIEKAAETVLEILRITQGKTLLLFKSYRDQKRAQNVLNRLINRKITFIDDSFESETVQKYVEQADIIMASASSRLWEGIDIRDLKLEIIFSLPFIRPPVYLEKNDGFQFTKRKMLIRLQQGIGRLIRNQDDKGICVILDKRLEKYKGSKDFAEAYREKIEPVSLDELVEKLKLLEKSK